MKTFLGRKLDTRRPKNDGSFPIIFRLTHFRNSTSISTGLSVQKEYWDKSKGLIKRQYKDVTSVSHLNNTLLKEFTKANDIINKLWDQGNLNYLSITEVKNRITGNNKYGSFFEFGNQLVEELKAEQRIGTARSYYFTLSRIRTFIKGKDLKLNLVNYEFLKRFEREHLSNGYTLNGMSSYMRTIRAILNKAIKAGILEKEAYPFDRYSIKTTPTAKRALDIDSLRKIMEVKLNKNSALFHYRNYFMLSYMMYGLSFMDLAFLKKGYLIDGRLKFKRRKTGKIYDIKTTDQMKVILAHYLPGKKAGDYILPILKRKQPELRYKDYEWERGRYNRGLKKIAEKCGIEQNITTYVPRHSFATQALFHNVPLAAISAMMGHSKLNTTQIYLKSLPNSILDDYNSELNQVLVKENSL